MLIRGIERWEVILNFQTAQVMATTNVVSARLVKAENFDLRLLSVQIFSLKSRWDYQKCSINMI